MTGVIRGQRVYPKKKEKAKELRRNMTETEQILWENLRGNKLEGLHFRKQQVIDGYIIDFYCHAARLVLEVDGGIHETQVEADLYRESVLKKRGLKILRVTNEEVKADLEGVLKRIRAACGRGEGQKET